MLKAVAPDWHPPLSTESEEAAGFYLEGLHRHLSILPAVGRSFDNAFKHDPTFGVGAAALAVAASGVGEVELARQALQAARTAAPKAPAMSRSHIHAVDALLTLPTTRALAVAGKHLASFPHDVFILAMTLQSLHSSGRRTRRQEALAFLDAAVRTGVEHFAVPSLRSVIVADVGAIDEARADAEAGLAANPRSAHAAHGLAHVFYETGDHEVGRDWLSTWTADFDPRASGVHLSWHLALHDLALGDVAGLLARYARSIRPHSSSSLYVDATDILWRSRLSGVAVKEQFAALRIIVPAVGDVRSTSLAIMQSVVVLAGDCDADGLRAAVRLLEASKPAVYRDAVLPIARALQAIVEGKLEVAVTQLASVDGELVALAGSNAQLDLVSQTLLWCYQQLGVVPPAEVFLVARVSAGSPARATGEVPRRVGRFRRLVRTPAGQGGLGF